jgi:hypothetical protein
VRPPFVAPCRWARQAGRDVRLFGGYPSLAREDTTVVDTSPVAWIGLGVAILSFALAVISLLWQRRTWRQQPQQQVRIQKATKRWQEEEAALHYLSGQIPSVIEICDRFIEQFPEDRDRSQFTMKAEIGGRKVAGRLGHFREEWRRREDDVRSAVVVDAHRAVGIDAVLRKVLSGTDDELLLPDVRALRSSLQALDRAIRATLT